MRNSPLVILLDARLAKMLKNDESKLVMRLRKLFKSIILTVIVKD